MTTTTLSSKGQLVIPTALRRALHLKPGARLRVSVERGRLVLEPERAQPARLVKERRRRVLVAPPGAPAMTTAEVKRLLSEFP
ncbi:MAG: AbrB/MazE/SpoVT family DNA-binding domain-containing protein [Candidatus Rokubacteria bacterium]|nr:AbrB/MazE/SpoVT family DNA-binding domain-containing protein [Candidatus Rokubacteria bacterium]